MNYVGLYGIMANVLSISKGRPQSNYAYGTQMFPQWPWCMMLYVLYSSSVIKSEEMCAQYGGGGVAG